MLEDLLCEQVKGDPALAGMLAKYGGGPAFFYSKSPPDTDRCWEKPCFPRADFSIDTRRDPERKTSGGLAVNIFCTAESKATPEELEKRLTELIDGVFYTAGGMDAVCAAWDRSDPFDAAGGGLPEVFGASISFALMAFPAQEAGWPGPIAALNAWTQANFPEAAVITASAIPPVWKPSGENPAIYWRPEGSASTDRQSYAATWYSGQFAAHIIAGGVAARARWANEIIRRIQRDGEVLMPDGSPMFAKQITIRNGADPLREGQLLLSGQYGVLEPHRMGQPAGPLNNIIISRL